MKVLLFSIVLFMLVVPQIAFSQACCSAGVPLLGSMELPPTPAGSWNFGLTFERNVLRDVLAGSSTLDDNLRQRTVHTLLAETSYGLSRRLSITVLLSLIQQERKISSPFAHLPPDELITSGFGDAVWLVKYTLFPLSMATQREISVGIGPKLPLGRSDLRKNGIFMPADMQPGSGAWDGVFWAYFYQGFLPATRFNLFGNFSSRYTGVSERGYRFGNESILSISTSYRTDRFFDLSLSFRYRTTRPDQFNNSNIPNTGGQWFTVIPGVNLKLSKNLSARVTGQIPLYRNLQGTQLTTSYRASLSLFYTLSVNKIPL